MSIRTSAELAHICLRKGMGPQGMGLHAILIIRIPHVPERIFVQQRVVPECMHMLACRQPCTSSSCISMHMK